ncbi:MAG: hypothetical protein JXN65_03230 [Clostridia bacterium]|nr:hypothetical protein [Clostridia bacterium]
MFLLPFEKFTIKTEKTKEEVLNDIIGNTNAGLLLTLFKGPKFFNGTVDKDTFKLTKSIFGRNSFMAVMIGKIVEEDYGCRIDVRMRMFLFSNIFFAIFAAIFAFQIIALFISLIQGNFTNNSYDFFILIPAICIIVAIAGFKISAYQCKEKLQQIILDYKEE